MTWEGVGAWGSCRSLAGGSEAGQGQAWCLWAALVTPFALQLEAPRLLDHDGAWWPQAGSP